MPIQPKVVIIVEDEWLVRVSAAEAVMDAGFVVIEAEDAESARASLRLHTTDVHALFTDICLPGAMDGLALAHCARALIPGLAILITSGTLRPGPGEMPPGSHFLSKPYSLRDLPGHIEATLVKA